MGCNDTTAGGAPAKPEPIAATFTGRLSLNLSVEPDGALIVIRLAAYLDHAEPMPPIILLSPEAAIDLCLRLIGTVAAIRKAELEAGRVP